MTICPQSNPLQRVLFVSHKEKRCGVHEYGISIAEALKKSKKYLFIYDECSNRRDFWGTVGRVAPSAIIYNYYPSTLPWLKKKVLKEVDVPNLGIMHEVTQRAADSANTRLFNYHIAPDPTLVLNNPIVFKTGRLIPAYINRFTPPKVTTIGSLGFASVGKGFERLVIAVQEEFDEAVIRLHIPSGDFVPTDAKQVARRCQELIVKDGVKLVVTHEFMERNQLLDFLAQNTLNAFFYEKLEGRGISSTIETALAVRRPIAVTGSSMFRHVLSNRPSHAAPTICIEPNGKRAMSWKQQSRLRSRRRGYLQNSRKKFPLKWLLKPETSLKQIVDNGIAPLERFFNEWSEQNLILDYERILDCVLGKHQSQLTSSPTPRV